MSDAATRTIDELSLQELRYYATLLYNELHQGQKFLAATEAWLEKQVGLLRETERERNSLRSALEEIQDLPDVRADEAWRIARDALEDTKRG